jgi:hypothetical protein
MELAASNATSGLPPPRLDGIATSANDTPNRIDSGKPDSRVAYALPAIPLTTLAVYAAGVLTLAYAKWQVDQNPEVIAQAAADITQKVSDTASALRQMGMNLPQPSKARVESLVGDMFAAVKSGQMKVGDLGHGLIEAIKQPAPAAASRPIGSIDPHTGAFSEREGAGVPVVLDRSGSVRKGDPVASIKNDDGSEIDIHVEHRKTADGKNVIAVGVVFGNGGGPGKEPKDLAKKVIEALRKMAPSTLLAASIAVPYAHSSHQQAEDRRTSADGVRPNFNVGNPTVPTVNTKSTQAIDALSASSSPEDIRTAYKQVLDLHYDEVVDTMREARWLEVLNVPGTGGPMFTDADIAKVEQLRQSHIASIDRIADPAKQTAGIPELPNGVALSGDSRKQSHLDNMLRMLDNNLASLKPLLVGRLTDEPAVTFDTQPLNIAAFAEQEGLQLGRPEDAKTAMDAVYRHHVRQAVDSAQSGLDDSQRQAVLRGLERWLSKDASLEPSGLPVPPVGGEHFAKLMSMALQNAALNIQDLQALSPDTPLNALDQFAKDIAPPGGGSQPPATDPAVVAKQQAKVIESHRARIEQGTKSIVAAVNAAVQPQRAAAALKDIDLKMSDFLPPGVQAPRSEGERLQALDRVDALQAELSPTLDALWDQSEEIAALREKPQWLTTQLLPALERDFQQGDLQHALRLEDQLFSIETMLSAAPLWAPGY